MASDRSNIRIAILTNMLSASVIEALEGMGGRRMAVEDVLSGPMIKGVEVLVTDAGVGADADMLGRFPDLRLVACYGIDIDAIHMPTARARGIGISNTQDPLTEGVDNRAMARLLVDNVEAYFTGAPLPTPVVPISIWAFEF